jgi:hypothetical protein
MNKDFENWFVGFFDGEGYFTTSTNNGKYRHWEVGITLAIDDLLVLSQIQKKFGGSIREKTNLSGFENAKLQAVWRIQNRKDIERLLLFFIQNPLRTPHKKACLEKFRTIFEGYKSTKAR